MLKILIVDDDPIDREGVCYLVEKLKFDILPITSHSAQNALDLLQNQHFDIVLTDIRMPDMDGLTLIEKAKAQNPMLQFIVFSAFGEFEYAKKALKLGVTNYLLKPVDVKEFTETINAVINMCKKDIKGAWSNYIIQNIFYKKPISPPNQPWSFGNYIVLFDFYSPILGSLTQNISEIINEYFSNCFVVFIDEHQLLVFTESVSIDSLISKAKLTLDKIQKDYSQKAIAVAGSFHKIGEDLSSIFNKMEELCESKFFGSENNVLTIFDQNIIDDGSEIDYDKYILKIETFMHSKSYDAVKSTITDLFKNIKLNSQDSAIFVKYIVNSLLNSVTKSGVNFTNNALLPFIKKIYVSENINELEAILLSFIDAIVENSNEIHDNSKKIIDDVLNIIVNEYSSDLSLESVAERVFLSPSYLSTLFKKQTGQLFIKYLTAYRLERAKQLLRSTDYKISSICEMVGYSCVSYFCLIFKNHYGITPLQYRENNNG